MATGAFHLAPQSGGFEPQRSFNWKLELQVPGGDIIALAADSAFMPQHANEPIELHYGNEHHYVAGKSRFQFGQIVCKDFITEDVNRLIHDWKKTVFDAESGELHYATNYKTDGHIVLVDPEGNAERPWLIRGLWPQQINYGGPIAYQANDIVRIEIILAYDRAFRA